VLFPSFPWHAIFHPVTFHFFSPVFSICLVWKKIPVGRSEFLNENILLCQKQTQQNPYRSKQAGKTQEYQQSKGLEIKQKH
jgi:hypothetical protein